MTSQHTPGPWRCEHGPGEYRIMCNDKTRGLNGYLGGLVIGHPLVELAANARLIAAAPDLLAALEAALQAAGPHRWWHDEARAAIAKARGQ